MLIALLLLVLLTACGRPLSPGETALAQSLFGDELDPMPVRVASFKALSKVTAKRPKRPRIACREKIWPEPKSDIVTTFTAAFVTFNRINIADELYRDEQQQLLQQVENRLGTHVQRLHRKKSYEL